MPCVRLHHHPAASAGVLDDVLAGLGQRHREAPDHARIGLEFVAEDRFRALLNALDDRMHVFAARDRRDRQPHVGLAARTYGRRLPVQLVEIFGETEEPAARPVRRCALRFGNGERGFDDARLREAQQRGEGVRRAKRRVPRIDEELGVCGVLRYLFDHRLEGLVIQALGNGDHGSHVVLNSPRRKGARPDAPRSVTLRAAANSPHALPPRIYHRQPSG